MLVPELNFICEPWATAFISDATASHSFSVDCGPYVSAMLSQSIGAIAEKSKERVIPCVASSYSMRPVGCAGC